jgi:uncharacterized protein (DUF342 family)
VGSSGPEAGEKRKSYLLELFKKFRKQKDEDIQEIVVPEPPVAEEQQEEEGGLFFLQQVAEQIPEPEEPEKPEEPADAIEFELPAEEQDDSDAPAPATVKVLLDARRMEAKLTVSPPEEGGRHVSIEQLKQALEGAGVVFGISDAMLNTVVRLKLYNKPCAVAKGSPAVDGMDGRVEYLFPQEVEARPNDRGDGTVDYKDLQLIRDIPKNTVIAEIIAPTPMQPGCTVLGKKLNGRVGRAVSIRPGKGTVLSEDGAKLLASHPGNLVWKNDHFEVEETLRISGSIDNAVGNVVFSGDVIVDGDVCEGYSIQSGRNVTVYGFVEGATIVAKGDVVLKKGMNGMGKGSIEAGGNVNCRFFENSEVYCAGMLEADSILNSTVSSEDKILLRGRRGAIMGGACSACNLIEARSIGTESHTLTEINLGASSKVLEKHRDLKKQVEKAEENIEMMEKDLQYMMQLASAGKLSDERRNILSQKNVDRMKAIDQLEDIRAELQRLDELVEGSRAGRLVAMTIYPPVHLTMSGIKQIIQKEENNVSYYIFEGKIKRGTKV